MTQYLGWIVAVFVLVTNIIVITMMKKNYKLQRDVDSLEIQLEAAKTNLELANQAANITSALIADYAGNAEAKAEEIKEIPKESQELSDEEKLAAIAIGAGRPLAGVQDRDNKPATANNSKHIDTST